MSFSCSVGPISQEDLPTYLPTHSNASKPSSGLHYPQLTCSRLKMQKTILSSKPAEPRRQVGRLQPPAGVYTYLPRAREEASSHPCGRSMLLSIVKNSGLRDDSAAPVPRDPMPSSGLYRHLHACRYPPTDINPCQIFIKSSC